MITEQTTSKYLDNAYNCSWINSYIHLDNNYTQYAVAATESWQTTQNVTCRSTMEISEIYTKTEESKLYINNWAVGKTMLI
jgi:hypothetical protein